MSLLKITDLSIRFNSSGGSVDVVSNLNLSIEAGTIFGLAGESGCGKSLTALSIMGILPKGMTAEGSVKFQGEELLGMEPDKLRMLRGGDMSMIFQEPMTSLNPVLKVGYQIEEVINTHLKVSKKEASGIALSLLRAMRIPSPEVRIREYPHQMSGGMRQRIMMAMAIACTPSLLIADEPTTALDVTIEAQLLELIRELRDNRDMGVLLITHDLGIIAENAKNVAIMYAGRIVETATVAELFSNSMHPYTSGLLGSLPKARGTVLTPIEGHVPKPSEFPVGCKFAKRCVYVIPRCIESEPELEALSDSPGHLSRCFRAEEAPWK